MNNININEIYIIEILNKNVNPNYEPKILESDLGFVYFFLRGKKF